MKKIRMILCNSNNDKGFSLFEILTVLVIFGILAAVSIPSAGRFMDNLDIRRQTQKFMSILRYARLMSITSAKKVHVTLENYGYEDCVFRLHGGIDEVRPCGLHEDDILMVEPEADIVFYPEGQATPALVTFVRDEKQKTIVVDLLTGMPRIE